MKVLIDTNVFIHREDDDIVPEPLRELEKTLKKEGHTICVHPDSIAEIRNDPDEERRERAESRIETYVELSYPPTPIGEDSEFREHVSKASSENEKVDNMLLFSVYRGAADFLITEDRGIHKKALRVNLEDRVFTIEEGREHFQSEIPGIRGPVSIQRTTLGELNLSDPIFDSLKDEYDNFVEWAQEKSERTAWVNKLEDGALGAILVLKPNEVEDIGENPSLGRHSRMKISTLKVSPRQWGSKVGELLLSIAVREAIHHELDEIYLTHYVDPEEDYLVELIEQYGFYEASAYEDGESIFVKRLTPPEPIDLDPLETARRYYPSFYEGPEVSKFIVPIQPQYHRRLFQSYKRRQPGLDEFFGKFKSEGNAIRKAYLSNAKTKQMSEGDILLFYRSHDHQEVTTLGVVEHVEYDVSDPDVIERTVGKRSVFSTSEINDIAKSPTIIILFTWHFDLPSPVPLSELIREGVLSAAPQTIQALGEEDYKYITREGGLDERFALY